MVLFDHKADGPEPEDHTNCLTCYRSEVSTLKRERDLLREQRDDAYRSLSQERSNIFEDARGKVFEDLILIMQTEYGYSNGAITTNEIGELRRILTQVIDGLETGHSAAQALSSLLARIEVRT